MSLHCSKQKKGGGGGMKWESVFSPSQDLHQHMGNFHFFVVVANIEDLDAAGSTHTHTHTHTQGEGGREGERNEGEGGRGGGWRDRDIMKLVCIFVLHLTNIWATTTHLLLS